MFPDDLIPRATQVLLPRWTTSDERSAWLAQAFFLAEPRLYNDLRVLDGQPIIILTNTITALLDAGCLPNKKAHALAQLLTSVRIIAPPEQQTEIDRLVPLLNHACADSKSKVATATMSSISKVGAGISSLKTMMSSARPVNALQSFETPLSERTPTVFISYSHEDDDFALRLIDDLQGGGHAVWIDKMNIKGGAEWVRSIADGISNSYAFVTLLSPDANISRWVQREYLYADNLGKPIFPVMARPSEVPFQMIDRQVLSLVEDYAMGLEQLLTVLPAPRAIVITQEMMQPPAPTVILGGKLDQDERRLSPQPAVQPQPPLQSRAPIPPPQAMPAPYVLPRKAGGATRRLIGLVGVLVVGAVGVSVILRGLTVNGVNTLATPGIVATDSGGGVEMPTDVMVSNSGAITVLLLVMVGAGIALVYFLLSMRRARVSSSPDFSIDDVLVAPGGAAMPARQSPLEQAKEAEREEKPSTPDKKREGFGDIPTEPTPETVPTPPMMDKRALELLYLNRVTAQRIDAMVDMEQPSPDDRVRVMALDSAAHLNINEADWAAVERQLPDKGAVDVLNTGRAILVGDNRQDAMTALWAAAGAMMSFATADPTKPIPIIADLSRWTENIPLEVFLAGEMGELGQYLGAMLKDKRAALFFDGLYTLSPERLAQVETFLKAHPELMAVVDMTAEAA